MYLPLAQYMKTPCMMLSSANETHRSFHSAHMQKILPTTAGVQTSGKFEQRTSAKPPAAEHFHEAKSQQKTYSAGTPLNEKVRFCFKCILQCSARLLVRVIFCCSRIAVWNN